MSNPGAISRRALLGAAITPGVALLAAPAVFASSRPVPTASLFPAPICLTAADGPLTILPGAPKTFDAEGHLLSPGANASLKHMAAALASTTARLAPA